jgi:hypothetical protein
VVVIRYPSSLVISLSSGLTYTVVGSVSGADKVCTITAGTGTVTWN